MGAPVRTQESSSEQAAAWLTGRELLRQDSVLIGTVSRGLSVGDRVPPTPFIVCPAVSTASVTSVALPSICLDKKLLLILTLQQDWHCSEPALKVVAVGSVTHSS